MKYARETIELMSAYPGRTWRMADLVRNVARGRTLERRERDAVRNAVLRVLDHLAETRQVEKHAEAANSMFYSWCIVRHGLSQMCDRKCDNLAGTLRP